MKVYGKVAVAVENMINEIRALKDSDFKDYLNKFPFANYSLFNTMLIYYQGGSQVAGFVAWNKLNRRIKKGSKSISILAPCIRKAVKETEQNGLKEIVEYQKLIGFTTKCVFDISQTEGQPIDKGMTISIKKDFDILPIAQRFGLIVDYKPLEIALGGYVSENKITLNSNLNETENKGTFLHELSHFVLGHSKSLDMNDKREKHEQEAETLTYLLCRLLGIERKSIFYLKVWNTNEEIKTSLFRISNAFSKIKKCLEVH